MNEDPSARALDQRIQALITRLVASWTVLKPPGPAAIASGQLGSVHARTELERQALILAHLLEQDGVPSVHDAADAARALRELVIVVDHLETQLHGQVDNAGRLQLAPALQVALERLNERVDLATRSLRAQRD